MTSLNFRIAKESDAPYISELENEIFSDSWSSKDISDTVNSDNAMCYVIESNGEIIAYLLGSKIVPEGEIYRIATHPSHKRRGYAKALLRYVLDAEKDLCDIYLEVRESNTPARNLYTGCGFKEISIRKNYYKSPTEDGINMHRAKG